MPPLCYFVRHGQTGWNAELRLQGQADTDMTDLGRSQAVRNGRRLAELVGRPGHVRLRRKPAEAYMRDDGADPTRRWA